MFKSILTVTCILATVVVVAPRTATAQNEVLAEFYGRGVHAYYAGDNVTAEKFLSMAIDNGSTDPRAYYFRGMVAYSNGDMEAAKDDWRRGAALEAAGNINTPIGRSLARFQGTGRLELETIREEAQLKALAEAAKRAKARYGEISAAESQVLRTTPPSAATPPATPPATAATPATPPAAAATPATPPAAATTPPITDAGDPFADDMAIGEPNVQSDDALKGAMENPFAAGGAVPAASVPPNDTNNPFGGAASGDASDPFGGGASAGADPFGGASDAGADPFGGSGDSGAGADPFGGGSDAGAGADPFGGSGDSGAGADPFGGGSDADPFGN
jgi:hypothetical protein